ncbi:MAG: sigma-70 family RNA polymerase sigma factor [Verrucomicrobiae bacterium]|nr:sigma-70 family RNA polymerase sigma factor [Verrucomicrobiae bacterium]
MRDDAISDEDGTDRTEEFLTLLNEHESALRAYVHSLVREPSDAEDILQETRLVMWRNFEKFEAGTHFKAWAKKIAFHQILTFRRKAKRDTALSEESLELLALELTKNESRHDRRAVALRKCVRQLSLPHRQIFLMRYSREMSIEDIASAVDRTEGAVYRLLSRLRASLQDCVNRNTPATS